MSDKKPAVKFEINIARVLTLGKNFKNGESEYGPWYGYSVVEDGEEKTMFADEQLQEQLKVHPTGKVLSITKQKQGKNWSWLVNPAIFDNHGGQPPPPPTSPLDDKSVLDAVRKDRKNVLYTCLKDAMELAELYNDEASESLKLDHQDVRAMAISFAIDFNRKY